MTFPEWTTEQKLVEALYYIYYTLGGDTDGCKDGACMLAHCPSVDGFIGMVKSLSYDIAQELNEPCDCAPVLSMDEIKAKPLDPEIAAILTNAKEWA